MLLQEPFGLKIAFFLACQAISSALPARLRSTNAQCQATGHTPRDTLEINVSLGQTSTEDNGSYLLTTSVGSNAYSVLRAQPKKTSCSCV